MPRTKPLKRTIRHLADLSYSNNGHWQYLLHPDFAQDPQHYVRSFLEIQKDIIALFKYVEPSDQNENTISLKIHELLTRICIELEANFTAILKENTYSNNGNLNMKNDYSLIEYTHKLSEYRVKFPVWIGDNNIRRPFENWSNKPDENWHALNWYQAYNKAKHDRHNHFDKATFINMLDAFSGLAVVLSAQFMSEDYSPHSKSLAISGNYSYDYDPAFDSCIGDYLQIQFPSEWTEVDRYDFNWQTLSVDENPIDEINYDEIKENNT